MESLCWAPDGRWLLFSLPARDRSRLRVASLDGKIQDLGDAPIDGQDPQWTQNPRVLAAALAPAPTPFPTPGPTGRTLVP